MPTALLLALSQSTCDMREVNFLVQRGKHPYALFLIPFLCSLQLGEQGGKSCL